ncbi:hypothetical protein H0H81_007187 [Sphagnurus paluster]|uniref:YTH domain-containing protein n=1 Tax=Sphagnurus paluster TaxID=117069 RepID=A0A9P7KMT8_9AGAR|nr:hypothetical protein H0H81_007187 [Sphagnurus paluster]
MSAQPTPPSEPASPPNSGGVRRHHTISASSRTARTAAREAISEEAQQQQEHSPWNDDEVVDEDWVGGVGAVGEKTSLHRQSFQGASKVGNPTPKTVNSLAAIAGHEGDEEPWNIAGGYPVEDEPPAPDSSSSAQHIDAQPANSPLSPHFSGVPPHVPSPPPAGSNVRRHVSLTYGSGVAGPRKMNATGLKRSGTLQTPLPPPPQPQQNTTPPETADRSEEDDYRYDAEDPAVYDDDYARIQQQQQYAAGPIGRHSPWAPAPANDWRAPGYSQNAAIDDVQRALSALELASGGGSAHAQMYGGQQNAYQTGQSAHPPRFNPTHPPPAQAPGMRGNASNNNGRQQLVTDLDGRKTPQGGYLAQQGQFGQQAGSSWDTSKETRMLNSRSSNPNLQQQYGYQAQTQGKGAGVPNVPAIPQQYLPQRSGSYGQQVQQQAGGSGAAVQGQQGFANTPIDVPSLIATKGLYVIPLCDRGRVLILIHRILSLQARYFVIKSYTEDDVHKSLKYEIWSSTDPGNKRLDKAFKETAGRGPIYLFFSVNASGHFCGMAEMLTPVDYTRSSTVWASDKWKGVFTVRWIFVRDIPNVNLRHIKLNNTQERKPVTNSRDTQELLPDAGQEMLRIFHTHPARTSLLQDFAFYELQAMQKMQGQQGSSSPGHSPDSGAQSPQQQQSPHQQHQQPQSHQLHQQHQHQQQSMFGLSPNPNVLGYAMPQMSPMMQMQMQMGMMGVGGTQYGMPQAQAMHQSVLRHPSPGPQNLGAQGFMGF